MANRKGPQAGGSTGGLFGSTSTANTSGGLFGSSATQSKNIFGGGTSMLQQTYLYLFAILFVYTQSIF